MIVLSVSIDIKISGPQQSWGYEEGPYKGLGPPLLVDNHLCWGPLIFNTEDN